MYNLIKTFNVGTVIEEGKAYNILIHAELKERDGKVVFTCGGEVSRGSSFICAGQCLDTIKSNYMECIKDRALFDTLYTFWKLYHLNDMRAGCEHQVGEEWDAKRAMTVYTHELTKKTLEQRMELEARAMKLLGAGAIVQLSPDEQELLTLKYSYKSDKAESKAGYALEHVENVVAGWIREEEGGILAKPCPICGYKYGTAWKFREIPKADIQRIIALLS